MPAKGVAKKGVKKKLSKKKVVDAFLKKEWYVIKVPQYMPTEQNHYRVGYSPANKAKAKKSLDNRTFVLNLADLMQDPYKNAYEKERNINFKFITEEVFGPQLLTQFHGMQVTRDHRCSLFRKERSMVSGTVDVKTSDGYTLRITALAFTKRLLEQVKKHAYAKRSQARQIRKKMTTIIRNSVQSVPLEKVIAKLRDRKIGEDIKKNCQLIYPLQSCLIEKVKVLRKPKKDVARTLAMHDLTHAFDEIADNELAGNTQGDEEKKEDVEMKDSGN